MSSLLFRSVLRYRTPSTSIWLLRTQIQGRSYAVGKKQTTNNESKTVAATNNRTDISTDVRPIGERIKENTKTASYIGVIAIGVAVTGVMLYATFRELLSSDSPNNVYSSALDKCINDTRVQDSLGAPIKGFGEESRRGRRQFVAHQMFERSGAPHIRLQFYIKGIRNKATVHVEKNLDTNEFRYLLVQLDHYPRSTIIIEDNRLAEQQLSSNNLPSTDSFKFT